MLEVLDLFGIAAAIAALRQGGGTTQLRAILRRISGVGAVIDRLAAAGAQVRYRRMRDAVCELEALAVSEADSGSGGQIRAFLSSDDTVVAQMEVATEAARRGRSRDPPRH